MIFTAEKILVGKSGAYVIMAENGSSTAEATAYLESMLSELGDSGSAVSATLKESTGMSFETLSKKGQSLGDIMKILSESVNGDRNAFRDLWDSSEAGVGALSLLQAGTEKYNDVLEQMEQRGAAPARQRLCSGWPVSFGLRLKR